MYGELLYGGSFGSTSLPLGITSEDISYNDYGLQNSIIITEEFNIFDAGDVELNTFIIPQDHGKGFLSKFWRGKTIKVTGIIKCDTQTELEAKLDELKLALRENEGVLKYKQGDGTYREITATCSQISFPKQFYNITWMPFEITFQSHEAFFYNSVLESKFYEAVATSPFNEEITNDGSEESNPQIYFFFTAATTVTTISITLNSRTITFTGTIVANDVLSFDGLNKKVFLNSVEQDYTGTFPKLLPGVNSITYTIDGTFSCDISNIYRLNFL